MKPPARNSMSDVAASVSDAKVVDWAEAESSAQDEQQKELVHNFKIIANIAEIHRSLPELSEEETTPAPQKTDIELPEQWGHLEILEPLGEGAYAEVHRARDTRLDREVALKLYYGREQGGDNASILKEGRLLARVRHPNVVTVYGADEHDGRVGLWMELVQGQTLSELVRSAGPFSSREAAGIGIDVCRAVAAIHRVGLLHRDIKAQNVMREEGGRILLLDLGFGSQRVVDSISKSEKRVAGTPVYMAPEFFRGESASVLSDIYAIGILLYFLTTGSFPYADREAILAIRESSKTLRDERPELPDDFITVVDRAFSNEPRQRFVSAGEMATELGKSIDVDLKRHLPSKSLLGAAAALMILILVTLWPSDTWREPPLPLARSIAVLPLNNRSDEEALDFLSVGVAHGIISRLSQLEQLRVVSGTSVERYRGTDINTGEVGRELSVQTLLTGHVDFIEGRIVVYVELVDTQKNRSLWGQRFVRRRGVILDVEEEFATQIAGALGIELSEGQAQRLARRYTSNPEAYELSKMGLFFAEKRTRPDLEKALGYYQQAIDSDPGYAKGYAGLADTYALLGTGYFVADEALTRDDALNRAREAAQLAIQLDEKVPEAHVSLGLLDTIDGNWPEAEVHYQRAITISPSLTIARLRYSRLLSFTGRHQEAILQAKKALELDPLSPLQNRNVGFVFYDARDYLSAATYLVDALELDPEIPATRDILALCYWYSGEGAKAFAEYDEVSPWKTQFFHLIDRDQRQEALAVLEQNASTLPRWLQPLYYMLAGEEATALNQLEELVAEGEPNVDMPLREKAFDHLLNDERFLRALELSNITWRHGLDSIERESHQ